MAESVVVGKPVADLEPPNGIFVASIIRSKIVDILREDEYTFQFRHFVALSCASDWRGKSGGVTPGAVLHQRRKDTLIPTLSSSEDSN